MKADEAKRALQQNRKINLRHYNAILAQYGEDVKAVSWGSLESQRIRFQVLSEIGDLEGKSILDVGCGFGDFYGFLRERIQLKSYLGTDINQNMITLARRKYPEASFEVRDIAEDPFDETYDYVFTSGIFGLKVPRWRDIMERMVSRMYELSRTGTGVNFLSKYTTGEKVSDSYYADPVKIMDFVYRHLSPRVILRHDYRPNDFTLHIYKPFI
jgi:SAM-dependent methyltransferase